MQLVSEIMARSLERCCCTRTLIVVGVGLLMNVLSVTAGDVNYRDVVLNRQSSDFMSRYFRRLYRRHRHCDEPALADRVRMADAVLTGTIRALEADSQRPGSDVARVEVKRIFKDYHQVCVLDCYSVQATLRGLEINFVC